MEDTDPLTPPDDRARLNAILDGLLDRRRRIAALQAEEAELLHAAQEFALARHDAFAADRDEPDDLPLRSVAAEIGAATLQSDRTVQARMGDAATLVARFPATLAALRAGLISRAHAAVIVDAGGAIPTDDARDAYESAVLAVAERETVGRLRPVARRLADLAHPVPLDERHRTARRDRRVWVADRDDGMAELDSTHGRRRTARRPLPRGRRRVPRHATPRRGAQRRRARPAAERARHERGEQRVPARERVDPRADPGHDPPPHPRRRR